MRPAFKYYLDSPFLDQPEAIFSDALGSDVSGESLLKRGIPLPLFPDYTTWRTMVTTKKRCGRCWQYVRNHADLSRHNELAHSSAEVYFPQGGK